ncbi:MAG: PKD domain-containing protein [Bacteroidia bacterium]|nr:PKD domain-containing protein [Bacteroidia bacterium]
MLQKITVYFLLLFLITGSSFAQTITGITPNNANMGASLNVTISGSGTNFTSATGVELKKGNIKIPASSINALNNTTLLASFNLPVGPTIFGDYAVNAYSLAPLSGNLFTINPTGGGQSYGFLVGNVFRDNNTNCIMDAGDVPMNNKVVTISPGGYTATTNSNGDYGLWVPIGSYSVTVQSIPGYANACTGGSVNVTLTVAGDTVQAPSHPLDVIPYYDLRTLITTNIPRPGFSHIIWGKVQNLGNTTSSASVLKILPPNVTTFISTPAPNSIVNDTLFYNVSGMSPSSYFDVQLIGTIPTLPTVSLGQQLTYQTWVVPGGTDAITQNNHALLNRVIQGSCDPNDKRLMFPENKDTVDQIGMNDTLLTYHIRFQNTGTDTAFNISVRDTLDTLLDPATIDLRGSSHPYVFTMTGKGAMEFYFENINLLDSNASEPLSHGYLEYSIKRKPGLVHGDVIKNTAHIYFDFNPAVITNTTQHTICTPFSSNITPPGPLSTCAGSPLTLASGTSGSSYIWSNGGTSSTTTVTNAGTYYLNVVDNVGCKSDTSSVTVTVSAGPVAAFSSSQASLTSTFTESSTGNPTSWLWSFGDGNTSTQQNPTHTYAAAGTYTVCLVANSACGTDSVCHSVTATTCNSPTAAFNQSSSGLAATFTDQSTNSPTSWQWSFGDGSTSSLQNPTHTYSATGTYNVCLVATSSCGSNTSCQTVVITCTAPQAAFGFTTSVSTVTFADQSTGTPTTWTWSFGDGGTSTQQNPVHSYTSAGSYVVCLQAGDACGTTSNCQTVTVTCPAPTSSFSFAGNGLTLSFTDGSTNATTWSWNFGDGSSTSSQQNPTHTYTSFGTYTVCQTVSNGCISSTTCKTVVVTCVNPQASFTYTASGPVVNFTNTSTGGNTYVWDFGDGSTATQASPSHTYATTGTFNVCLSANTTDCGSNTNCQTVLAVGIEEEVSSLVKVYPNPATHQINLEYAVSSGGELTLNIYSATGQQLLNRSLGNNPEGQIQLPLHDFANGIYLVRLSNGSESWTRRIDVRK